MGWGLEVFPRWPTLSTIVEGIPTLILNAIPWITSWESEVVDNQTLKEDINILRADVQKISDRQMQYVAEHHKLEKEMVAIKTDLSYIRKGQESVNANMNKLMFIDKNSVR